MKKQSTLLFGQAIGMALLLCGVPAQGLFAQCSGEVLNISTTSFSQTVSGTNWVVPAGGPYKIKITAKGAKGGEGSNAGAGSGAIMIGEFIAPSGQTLLNIAGSPGQDASGSISLGGGGGGGGTGSQIQGGPVLILAGGGGGGGYVSSGGGGTLVSGNGNGGSGNNGTSGGAGGGGLLSSGTNGGTNGVGNAPTGGGAGFGATGGTGRDCGSTIGGNGGGGFGGGGGGNCATGGGGGGGYSGGSGGTTIYAGGGGSYNVGANQNNTAGANNAGGQVVIECLGAAAVTFTATPTQPVGCPAISQGSVSIDLTGDLNGNTTQTEYAIAAGATFSGSPTFASLTADPFNITSGFGTTGTATYTVRVRLKYNPTVFVDRTYTITEYVDDVDPVINNTPPNIPCQEATSPAGRTVFYNNPTAMDNCDGPVPVYCILASGSTFPLGTSTVVCTATDAHFNSANTDFTITVCDQTPPTINNTPSNIPCVEATSPNGAVVTYINPTATDIVDGNVSVVCVPASGSTFAIGTTTVTCTSTDAHANTSSTSFTVTVCDKTPPVITQPPNIPCVEATSPYGATVFYTNPTAVDVADPNPVVTASPVSGSPFPVGMSMVTVSAHDAYGNNAVQKTFTVNVCDTSPPVISQPPNITCVEATSAAGAVVTFSVSASDIVDGAVTVTCVPASGSVFALGTTTVVCSSTDLHGNSASASFTVEVCDHTPPNIIVPGNIMVNNAPGTCGQVVNYTVTAIDIVDGPVPAFYASFPGAESGSTFPVGQTLVLWGAHDSHNNATSSGFFVIVSDNEPPVPVCKTANVTLNAAGTATIAPADVFMSGTDNCGGAVTPISVSPNSFTCSNLGANTVTLTVRDSHGNTATCTATVNVAVSNCSSPGPHTWTGQFGTDWASACNWNPMCTPGAGDDVTIPNTPNKPVITTEVHAKTVKVLPGATLTIGANGWLEIDGPATEQALMNSGTVDNNGTIRIGESTSPGYYGIFNKGTFNNNPSTEGGVRVNRSTIAGIYNLAGVFNNHSRIEIGDAASPGHFGIFSDAPFSNAADGEIFIDRATESAIESYEQFDNFGTIKIGSDGSGGPYGIKNLWSFTNKAGGLIEIDNTTINALYNYDFLHPFDNFGTIKIGSHAAAGLFGIDNEGTFNNKPTGRIDIDRTTQFALRNASGLGSPNFDNAGVINLGVLASVGQYGITNFTLFKNQSTGVITATSPNKNNGSGQIINNGTINAPPAPINFVQSGLYKGSGSYVGTLSTNTSTGIIAPGNSPGCLHYSGDLTNEGTFQMELGGLTDCSEHDKIEVGGTATISPGATLTVSLVGNSTFVGGNSVTLLSAASRVGTFTNLSLPPNWSVVYTPTEVQIVYATALPIELGDFTAKKDGEKARLDWQTFSERSNLGFDIERSPDGVSFEKTGFAAGQGTSVVRHDYLFFDESPFPGLNYYRLRQIDFDGKTTLSTLASVDMGGDRPGIFVFPNPISGGDLNIRFSMIPADEPVLLRLFDVGGRLVLEKTATGTDCNLGIKAVAAGAYQLEAKAAGEVFRKKILVE